MSFDIWRNREPIADQAYDLDNYKIIQKKDDGVCVIYCSSNDIWYPNEKDVFEKRIFVENRFEWENIRYQNAGKEIFVRDIYKSWYVTGINSRIDSMDKLLNWLGKETEGYEVIVIGSSAGGYLASVISLNLNVSHAIVFSPQFFLNNKHAFDVNPFLQKYEAERGIYYRCNFKDKLSAPIYYFYPSKSVSDRIQRDYIEGVSNVRVFEFQSSRHGIPCFKCDLIRIINMSKEELEALWEINKDKIISPFFFSIKISGTRIAAAFILKNIPKLFKKQVNRYLSLREK